MNRNQWFILGFGMILIAILFGILGSASDCFQMAELLDGHESHLVDWCFNKSILYGAFSYLLWGFAILFIASGFLDSKKKYK